MIDPSLFSLFITTSFVNIVSPGICTVLIIALSLQKGWRGTFWANAGVVFGLIALFTLAVSGIGLMIMRHVWLYTAIKCLGIFFLFYLAYKNWVKRLDFSVSFEKMGEDIQEEGVGQFWKYFVISFVNPQPMVFGLSVFPQFISPQYSFLPQVALMISAYGLMAFFSMVFYALIADRARVFLKSEKAMRILYRTVSIVFVLIALLVGSMILRDLGVLSRAG